MSYRQFLGADPVVVGELDVELDEQISLLKRVPVLGHTLSSHHPDGAWRTRRNTLETHNSNTEEETGSGKSFRVTVWTL